MAIERKELARQDDQLMVNFTESTSFRRIHYWPISDLRISEFFKQCFDYSNYSKIFMYIINIFEGF